MKLIKTFIASLLAIEMNSAPVSGESMLKEILSSGVLKAGTTGDFFPFSKNFFQNVSNNIINSVSGINRVVYDITTKPPSTIELE